MRVRLIDITTARSDGREGGPSGVTEGQEYTVVEIEGEKYSIINDKHKVARYSQHRFEVVDNTPPEPIRKAFNILTHPVRMENKALNERVEQLEKELEGYRKFLTGLAEGLEDE